ncbi:MAG: glycine cleavage system protein GcvH [Phycisphaerales bacterium JB039]
MASPDDRRYSETHEWHRLDGDIVTIGLTQFAIDQLTDVTFVEMKPPGETIGAGEPVGEVESVKTTSDVYCAAPGEIVEVNGAAVEDPSLLNRDPYGDGWLIRLRTTDPGAVDSLMSASDYDAQHAD